MTMDHETAMPTYNVTIDCPCTGNCSCNGGNCPHIWSGEACPCGGMHWANVNSQRPITGIHVKCRTPTCDREYDITDNVVTQVAP